MLSFPAAIKVYLCTVPCDMRRSFDGLSMMAEHQPRDSRVDQRTDAHQARLDRDAQRRPGETVVAQSARGLPDRDHLSVRGGIH